MENSILSRLSQSLFALGKSRRRLIINRTRVRDTYISQEPRAPQGEQPKEPGQFLKLLSCVQTNNKKLTTTLLNKVNRFLKLRGLR